MNSPDTPLLDVHAHYSPPRSPETARALWEAGRREHFLLPEPFEWRLDETLDVMDRTGTAMQLLSNVPTSLTALRDSNDYGAQIVGERPSRFGLLAALPTDDPDAAQREILRHATADGWAVTTVYNGHSLADPALDPVWQELDNRHAVVFVHPNAYAPAVAGLPAPLAEVAFDTGRTVVAMLYSGVFRRFPNLTFVIAHAGGTLPVLAGRLSLLGSEAWVPNPQGLSRDDIAAALRRLWVDTAASASNQQLAAAVETVGEDHIVYGSDWGVPCTNEQSLVRNIQGLRATTALSPTTRSRVRDRARELFTAAARRAWRSTAYRRPRLPVSAPGEQIGGGNMR